MAVAYRLARTSALRASTSVQDRRDGHAEFWAEPARHGALIKNAILNVSVVEIAVVIAAKPGHLALRIAAIIRRQWI